jgi:hypothetical protein
MNGDCCLVDHMKAAKAGLKPWTCPCQCHTPAAIKAAEAERQRELEQQRAACRELRFDRLDGDMSTKALELCLQAELMECPSCEAMVHTVAAEGVPAQALRACKECGEFFYMDLESNPIYEEA